MGKIIINKGYKFRIYPNKEQEILIQKTFGCCRFVFNYTLATHKRLEDTIWEITQGLVENGTLEKNTYKSKFFNKFSATKALPELKSNHEFLKEVDSNALIAEIGNLEKAYKKYYQKSKSNHKVGKPKFKHKESSKTYSTNPPSIYAKPTINNGKYIWETHIVSYENSQIKINKLGWVKAKLHMKMKCIRIYGMTISQSATGEYYCSLKTEEEISEQKKGESSVGIVLADNPIIGLSNGSVFENPNEFTQLEQKIKKEQKILSRMMPDSNRYNKQKLKVAKLHEKIRRKREYNLHCLSKKIVNEYDEMSLVTVKGIGTANINTLGLYALSEMIRYKAEWQNKLCEKYTISNEHIQTCSECGVINATKITTDYWKCSSCEQQHKTIVNIAKNIHNRFEKKEG